ncbi:MAG: hypothetical protein M5T61_15870 [Acidimicrobiia bacterium]|nr:hypothetical protein [Acidimicrobiia bacterium]
MTGTSTPAAVVIDPARFDAVIFDMDGVVTDTAGTHQAAWAHLFDEHLATRPPAANRGPFTSEDYRTHVDGRARVDGVASFLAARGIALPPGAPEDPPMLPPCGASPTARTATSSPRSHKTHPRRSPPPSS